MSDDPELKTLSKDDLTDTVGVVVGTRPSIVMFSPIIRELERRDQEFFVVHTGQHYSDNMDAQFFEDLNLPEPDYKFEHVKECTYHGEQTAEMLKGCEEVFLRERPRMVLVGGDANFNIAGALAARKLHIRIGHVEAGARSGDWRMPEEHNRVMLDHISEYLFTTNDGGRENLEADNVAGDIHMSGNPIVDAAVQNREIAREQSDALARFGLTEGEYALMTLHREENVDTEENLRDALHGVDAVTDQFDMPVLFLAHPRTQDRIEEFGMSEFVADIDGLNYTDAVGYLDFLRVLDSAAVTLTDSGGVQQESCILDVPCVTLRDTTEWEETLDIGANTLVGTDPERIVAGVERMLDTDAAWENPFGDDHAAERIVDAAQTAAAGEDDW
ncbi:non-hydrolyzing UDP-N-acetylglucosamine 2-epimerase [Halorientalis litorea]|uniref:non-hydrolyzing UDP-N-acetylglucosamine 2-epimerase n=1 Tax=Halorientalis litorea TaxID=2931977 RepID=UPI001FF4F725|nr:UDP-N-acetylglucosamine 2-epimerase (non-hydrolyzing) [Halorientalis litorea]